MLETHLGNYEGEVERELQDIASRQVIPRIWARDHTVWRDDPSEVSNRLGWLDIAQRMGVEVPALRDMADATRAEGLSRVVLVGMGGSSLAPEMFAAVFGPDPSCEGMQLTIADTTDPDGIAALSGDLDLRGTLFIVATKSGGTVETVSLYRYFFRALVQQLGAAEAGRHFVAITDAGSALEAIAERRGFRAVVHGDPNIGGRFSALSAFGLLPAELVGVDVHRLLRGAERMAAACGPDVAAVDNPAARLGAALGVLAQRGRDKLTLLLPSGVASFGDWVEQLLAESTGKDGKGILPVVHEPAAGLSAYGPDRVFVRLVLGDQQAWDDKLQQLHDAGHPVITLGVADRYDLGAQIFLWEMATAVAGHVMKIQPFDQPNVESAKVRARQALEEYRRRGSLPALEPLVTGESLTIYGDDRAGPADGVSAALDDFLVRLGAVEGAYIAIQAYVAPGSDVDAALRDLRAALWERTGVAVTAGYGPRFLHSTGQLHKGDGGKGLFLQIVSRPRLDLPIPDSADGDESSVSFGVLKEAQALGDRQALIDAGRSVLRIDIGHDVGDGLLRITNLCMNRS